LRLSSSARWDRKGIPQLLRRCPTRDSCRHVFAQHANDSQSGDLDFSCAAIGANAGFERRVRRGEIQAS
jgi:hypothetical protein